MIPKLSDGLKDFVAWTREMRDIRALFSPAHARRAAELEQQKLSLELAFPGASELAIKYGFSFEEVRACCLAHGLEIAENLCEQATARSFSLAWLSDMYRELTRRRP
jgi:hypothetical protein